VLTTGPVNGNLRQTEIACQPRSETVSDSFQHSSTYEEYSAIKLWPALNSVRDNDASFCLSSFCSEHFLSLFIVSGGNEAFRVVRTVKINSWCEKIFTLYAQRTSVTKLGANDCIFPGNGLQSWNTGASQNRQILGQYYNHEIADRKHCCSFAQPNIL